MPLKKGGERGTLVVTLKNVNIQKLKEISKKDYRPVSQTLDMILEQYFTSRENNKA